MYRKEGSISISPKPTVESVGPVVNCQKTGGAVDFRTIFKGLFSLGFNMANGLFQRIVAFSLITGNLPCIRFNFIKKLGCKAFRNV